MGGEENVFLTEQERRQRNGTIGSDRSSSSSSLSERSMSLKSGTSSRRGSEKYSERGGRSISPLSSNNLATSSSSSSSVGLFRSMSLAREDSARSDGISSNDYIKLQR